MTYTLTTDDDGHRTLGHPAGDHKAAFDLTKTYGRDAFRDLMDRLDLTLDDAVATDAGFIWHGPNVAIRTYCNPLNGIHYTDWQRAREIGVPRLGSDTWDDEAIYPQRKRLSAKREHGFNRKPDPAYCSYVHIVGAQSEVFTAYNHLRYNADTKGLSLNEWKF